MSFLEIPSDSDFSYENLPYGVFSTPENDKQRLGVAIGDHILDLSVVRHLFNGPMMVDHRVRETYILDMKVLSVPVTGFLSPFSSRECSVPRR